MRSWEECCFYCCRMVLRMQRKFPGRRHRYIYKVGFYASPNYHQQNADGRKSGYGYEMMQNVSRYIQGTFSYAGYDKTVKECEEMLKNGEIDILTGNARTPECEKYFAFSTHPAITATTCMNVKAGNRKVVAGDYSTYEGLRIGLLTRHTYNDSFIAWTKDKGFDCDIVYYDTPTELSNALIHDEEQALLSQMQVDHTVIRAVMNPDAAPYSWFENGEAKGILPDIFRATAERLGLDYEIRETRDRETYRREVLDGNADIWIDMDSAYEEVPEYKITEGYLTTTASVLHRRGAYSGNMQTIAVTENNTTVRNVITQNWPGIEVIVLDSLEDCTREILHGKVDGALLMTYEAQRLAQQDVQNQLSVDIVPGMTLEIHMGVNSRDDVTFYGLWNKTLNVVANQVSAETVQQYLEQDTQTSMVGYLYDHPSFLVVLIICMCLILLFCICRHR